MLQSIYEGDTCFKELSPTCFQYMFGENEFQSILLEISWPEMYPTTLPNISLGKLELITFVSNTSSFN